VWRWLLLTTAAVLALALAFWVPAARGAPGWYLAPLDDVFIYFDYARSTALGHPLAWVPGNGYATGATSPPYALVLALGYLVGLRGPWLGAWAAAIAVTSLVDLCRSLRKLSPEKAWAPWLAPLVVLAAPLLDWSFFSGMEAAFFAAVAGRALTATAAVAARPEPERPRAQLDVGLWCALLALSRPEALALALALAIASTHASGRLPALPGLLRSGAPPLLALAVMALVARLATGEAAAAGAVRKLVTSDPYASRFDVAIRVLTNAVRLLTEGLEPGLGGRVGLALALAIGAAALFDARRRRLAVALWVGALGAFALVTLNTTAPFQNFRYLVPTLLCLLLAVQVGLAGLEARGARPFAAGVAAFAVLAALNLRELPRQIDHFARATKNVVDQQVEVGLRLGALEPRPRRVFLNDAGAIPYVSGLPALDGLGLGGYHDLPFARASVHGWPAVIELVERMPPAERPDVLAIYDAWWPGLAARFGTRIDAVRVEDNLILGHPEKALYRADWASLGRPDPDPARLVRLDVADLVDERAHDLDFTRPRAGYVVEAALLDEAGRRRWEAGRVFAPGQGFALTLPSAFAETGARVRLTTDTPEVEVELRLREDTVETMRAAQGEPGHWSHLEAQLGYVMPGDRLAFRVRSGGLRVFVVEVLRLEATASAPP
jgi:hypothetical protein